VNWIRLAQDVSQWWDNLSTTMGIQILKDMASLWQNEELSFFQIGLYFTEISKYIELSIYIIVHVYNSRFFPMKTRFPGFPSLWNALAILNCCAVHKQIHSQIIYALLNPVLKFLFKGLPIWNYLEEIH
jgi:hypothetical protein